MGNISLLSVLVGLFCLQFVYSRGPYGGGGGGGGGAAPLIGGGGGAGPFGRVWCTCRRSCKKNEFCLDKCRFWPLFPGWYSTCCRWLPYSVFGGQNGGVVSSGGYNGGGVIGQKY